MFSLKYITSESGDAYQSSLERTPGQSEMLCKENHFGNQKIKKIKNLLLEHLNNDYL